MSVLIRGMDMPSRCDECILTSGGECIFLGIDAEMDSVDMNCPLVEVNTPHGKLADISIKRAAIRIASMIARNV